MTILKTNNLHIVYNYVQIICFEKLYKFQVFLYNTNNLQAILWLVG